MCGVRPRATQTKLSDDIVLDRHPGVKSRIHHMGWFDRCRDLAHQIRIAAAKQGRQDVGVAMGQSPSA